MRRGFLVSGIVLLVAIATAVLVFVPPAAPAVGLSGKEAGAAFLGLVVLVVAVLGPDIRDWM